jgi:hypothetical protein
MELFHLQVPETRTKQAEHVLGFPDALHPGTLFPGRSGA